MAHAFRPGAVERLVEQHQVEPQQHALPADRGSFAWSRRKLRVASLVLAGAAAPVMAAFAVAPPGLRWLCTAALAGVLQLMRGLSRRAWAEAAVLTVDQHGILDRRLMPRRIAWQEIRAVCPVDTDRSHTIDIELRWPTSTLGAARWPVRVGAYCQTAYGVPALTISMLLLDGSASDLLEAIARFRPDLLDPASRRAARTF